MFIAGALKALGFLVVFTMSIQTNSPIYICRQLVNDPIEARFVLSVNRHTGRANAFVDFPGSPLARPLGGHFFY
jgi:hypothetical protein